MQLTKLCPDVAAWLLTICQLFFLLLTMQPACSSGHMEDPWEKKKKKRKAICASVLKVRIIQPLRFNGYSSWLTNNLLWLHYFICFFPYEKQRIEKEDQRLPMSLCFESQNAIPPSNNREGFYVWAWDSHRNLARHSRWRLPKKYFSSLRLPAFSPSPQIQSPAKPEVQSSSCLRLPCQPSWKAFCPAETAAAEGTNCEKLVFPVKQDKAEVRNVIPRHDWSQEKIWGGNSSFVSYHTCTVQHSSHLITLEADVSRAGESPRLMSPGAAAMLVLGLGWGRSFQELGKTKFKQPSWIPTLSETSQSASAGLRSILACLQHDLEASFLIHIDCSGSLGS